MNSSNLTPSSPGVAGAQSTLACPDAKRNLLDDLNLAESTLLPAPGDKESVAVFLRVKPRWGRVRGEKPSRAMGLVYS